MYQQLEVLHMTNAWYPKSYMEQSFKSSGIWFQNLHFNQHLKNTTCLVYNQRKSTIIYKQIIPRPPTPFPCEAGFSFHVAMTSHRKDFRRQGYDPDVYYTRCLQKL